MVTFYCKDFCSIIKAYHHYMRIQNGFMDSSIIILSVRSSLHLLCVCKNTQED